MALRHRSIALLVVLLALPFAAQAQTDDRIAQLEKRLNDLTQQVVQIRQELDQLKGVANAGTAPAPPAAEEQDLTKAEVVNAAPATGQTAQSVPTPAGPGEQPQSAMTDVQTVNNASNPGASKVFNPDTSVIGNFLGHAGQSNRIEFGPDAMRPPMELDEAEVAFEAFIDPYAKGKFFLSITPSGIDVEEGFANFLTLPYDLTAKVGKMKATFGKDNTWHTHVRPWADQPLVIHNFFGDEGLNDSGVSVSRVFANPYAYVEATGEVFSGNAGTAFARHGQNDLFYNAHVKAFKDISENSNVEVGTSYARGTTADPLLGAAGRSQFSGVDVTYRWKPLEQGLYRGLITRFEGITNRRADLSQRLWGFYASADYQLGQRWFTGVRLDQADRPTAFAAAAGVLGGDHAARDRGVSGTLTFWPSEFSQIRGQLRRTSYGNEKAITEFFLQLQFSIGAHGAHTF
ncbi:MAG: hypothetical protein ABI837_17880 [Acidobacteriota bacterium]